MTAIMRPHKTCPRCRGRYEADALFCPKDGARLDEPTLQGEEMPERDRYLGTTIAGDISIQSIAGQGAMGRVYRAHQRGIDRDVAVKILHRELSSNNQLVARFHREAKIASKLSHPHVVELFLVGQLEDGALYQVMEFLDGVSLAGAIKKSAGPLTLERALALTLQICDAVGEAHARGIVHRDLKPENVMLIHRADVAEWVKVLDFGIAKLTIGEQSMETAAGLIFGTARYISPEGAQGRPVGPQGDVYAIATMLFEMLAGRTPFEAEPLGLLIKHIHESAPDIRSVNAAGKVVPEAIARVIAANLAKEPTERAAHGRAFAAALVTAARESQVSLADVGAVARMSQLPAEPSRPAPKEESDGKLGIAPTIDDFGPLPAPPSNKPVPVVVAPERARSEAPRSRRIRSSAVLSLLLVFALGCATAGLLLWRFVVRPDEDRRLYHEHVRVALAEGHYVTPPNGNVRDLVDHGLEKWPNDGNLLQMKSEAEKEMITMSIAARGSGDLVGARNLARDALALENNDNSARYMRAQSEDELLAAERGSSALTGMPRVIFDSPLTAKQGTTVTMTGRIIFGIAAANAKGPPPVTGMKISLLPNGKTAGGQPVVITASDPNAIKATLVVPGPGSYDVVFEADVAGTIVRALRDLDVSP